MILGNRGGALNIKMGMDHKHPETHTLSDTIETFFWGKKDVEIHGYPIVEKQCKLSPVLSDNSKRRPKIGFRPIIV